MTRTAPHSEPTRHAGDDAGSATVPERLQPPGAAPGQHTAIEQPGGILGWIYRCCYLHRGYATEAEARRSLEVHLAGPLHAAER